MSAVDAVLNRFPGAYAVEYGGECWAVLVPLGVFSERIGEGATEDEAWEDATRNCATSAPGRNQGGEA